MSKFRNIKLMVAGALLAGMFMLAGPALKASATDNHSNCGPGNGVTNASAISVSGTTASVHFTVPQGCQNVKLSFVSYQAPAATFSSSTADQQVLYQQKTDYFNAGSYTWTITIPDCYFQADLVYGDPIVHLSANNLYGSLKIVGLNGGTQSCGEQDHTQVTLCHATSSTTNPYVRITVDAHGAYHGHYLQHQGPVFGPGVSNWGDIIPPFTFDNHSYALNWTTAGQAIFNNDCMPVEGGHGGGPQIDCDGDYDNSPSSECVTPQPQKDCDEDYDNSPASECNSQSGGQGGGQTGGTTTQSGGQVLGASTTATGGQGAGSQVSAVPQGSVNGGFGGATKAANQSSLVGLIASVAVLGSGLMLARRQN